MPTPATVDTYAELVYHLFVHMMDDFDETGEYDCVALRLVFELFGKTHVHRGVACLRRLRHEFEWQNPRVVATLTRAMAVLRWIWLRSWVSARAVGVQWHSYTARLYAPGGPGRKRDRDAFEADHQVAHTSTWTPSVVTSL